MKTIIIYFLKLNSSNSLQANYKALFDEHQKPCGWTRIETHEGKSLLEALDAAKPLPGEAVLNSVEL